MTQPERLDADEAAEVLARAAATQARAGRPTPDGLDDDAVVAIGREVGLPEQAVRRALAEHRATVAAALLVPGEQSGATLPGGGTLTRSRALHAPVGDVRERLDDLLSRSLLRPLRNTGAGSVWVPHTGVVARVRRKISPPGPLSWISRLQVQLVPVAAATTEVVLVAACEQRLRSHRAAAGGSALVGLAGLGTAVAGAVVDPSLLLAVPAAVAALGGAGVVTARGSWLRLMVEVGLSLDGLLDAAEHRLPVSRALLPRDRRHAPPAAALRRR